MLDQDGLPAFLEARKKLDAGFSELPGYESEAPGMERLAEALNATAKRLQDNYPYFHPLYAGQVLQIEFEAVPCDASGRMDVSALAKRAARGDVGTVVATLGTTATGSVDPLPEILALCTKHGFRIHADAAYGGYFALTENLGENAERAFARIGEADSIVIDPHKHGLQPYGCGCVLFRDPRARRFYKHDSPYTYFSSAELNLGELILEASPPGAAAAALWATQRLLPLKRGG